MNQVQILPVDMSVGIENKGVDLSTGKDASKGSDDFGAILAKHSVDSEKGGKPGKTENMDGNNSPEEKTDSPVETSANNNKQATSEKVESTADSKRIGADKEGKEDEASTITIPSEKELKSEQTKDVLLENETDQDKSLKTADDALLLFGKNIEREAMPKEVDELPDELVRKTDNAIKSNNDVLENNAEKTEDKANKLLTMLDEIKGISTDHVKISEKNNGLESVTPPRVLDLKNEEQNAVKVGEKAQQVDSSTLPIEETLLDTQSSFTTDKTVIAKAVEQKIQLNNITRESVVSEEAVSSDVFKEQVDSIQSNVSSDKVAAKAELTIGDESVSVEKGAEQDADESTSSKSKVDFEPTIVSAKPETSIKENKEQEVADLSIVVSQNNNVKVESAKDISEAKSDLGKPAQADNAASVRMSNQGSSANQENSDNKHQTKQQPLEADKAILAEQKLANSAGEQAKPDLETAKVERTVSAPAPVAINATSSVASAQALVDRLTMEANPVTNVKQQTVVADVISINRPDFSNAVKEKVMVMINQKIRQLDIRLDPPELGSMQIKVNMQNEQAVVSFMVQNQGAKEAVEQQLSRFKEMMSESGVDVGEANVSQQQEKDQGELANHQNEGQQSAQTEDADENNLAVNPAQLYKASSTGVDYFV